MIENITYLLRQAQSLAQTLALFLVIALTVALISLSGLALAGVVPWPEVGLRWNGAAVPQAGLYLQLGLTGLFVLLCFFLPANMRMRRLERSHRAFQISMEDVKRAYALAHAADRKGVFALSGEFDAMRQRMELLRKHADLGQLEPELLELAAQMSFESRNLARVYADEKVARAKDFLKARQQEAEVMRERISLARSACEELRRWLVDVEADERKNHQQIKRLEADLREVLPALGYDFEENRDANVVALPKPAEKAGVH